MVAHGGAVPRRLSRIQAQGPEEGHHRHLPGQGGPVLHLQGHAQRPPGALQKGEAVVPVRAPFGHHGEPLHEEGVHAPRPRHQVGVAAHGLPHPEEGRPVGLGRAARVRQEEEGPGGPGQGEGEGGDAAPVGGEPGPGPGEGLQGGQVEALDGVVRQVVPLRGRPQGQGRGQHPGVLPRAVVVQGVGARPWASRAARASREKGGWTPQTRCSGPSPSFPRKRAATSTCRGVPSWLAVAKATSSSVRPKRSTAPVR